VTAPISPRARALPPSPIRKLVPMADQAKARGTHVFHLNIGQPDLPTPPECLAAVRNFDLPLVAYSPSQGEAECVDFWVDYYKNLGFPLATKNVQVTTGGSEAILFALMGVASPGEEVLVPEPFYTNYRTMAQMAGLSIAPITTRPEDGYHLPSEAAIERAINSRTKAIILCNPNNPTGTVYTNAELEMIARLVKKHSLFWIADEVYREFVYGDEPARSALSFPDLTDRVVVVDSVSKRFSACGARVGALVSKNDELMSACLRMAQARLSSPLFGQVLTAAGRQLKGDFFAQSREEYRRRRDLLHEMLNQIPGVFSRCPEGAFYTMARLPVPDAEAFASWLLTDYARGGKTVMVAPGAGFYATDGLGKDEVRIAYVLKVDDIRESMEILRDALAAYPHRIAKEKSATA
jgi:aspartate aminotransferase